MIDAFLCGKVENAGPTGGRPIMLQKTCTAIAPSMEPVNSDSRKPPVITGAEEWNVRYVRKTKVAKAPKSVVYANWNAADSCQLVYQATRRRRTARDEASNESLFCLAAVDPDVVHVVNVREAKVAWREPDRHACAVAGAQDDRHDTRPEHNLFRYRALKNLISSA